MHRNFKIVLFFFLVFNQSTFAQCVTNITISSDGIGGYTFTADSTTSTSVHYLWTLNSDTLTSNLQQTSVNIDSNGSYTICLSLYDSTAICSFDTCVNFDVTDAEYLPLLDSINIWWMFHNICWLKTSDSIPSCNHCPLYYYTYGDTILDSILYKKIYSGGTFDGYIREDISARKVYYRYADNNSETIMYDFSLMLGEIINFDFIIGNYYDGQFKVDSIKIYPINSIKRRVLFLNSLNNSRQLIWIEGVGNLMYPIYQDTYFGGCTYFNCSTEYNPYHSQNSSFVTCFEHSEKVYYDSCAYQQALQDFCLNIEDECNYYDICGAVNEVSSLTAILIFPNPASVEAVIQIHVRTPDIFLLSIFNLEGKKLRSFSIQSTTSGQQKEKIDISNLPSGSYFIECRTSNGDRKYEKLLVTE